MKKLSELGSAATDPKRTIEKLSIVTKDKRFRNNTRTDIIDDLTDEEWAHIKLSFQVLFGKGQFGVVGFMDVEHIASVLEEEGSPMSISIANSLKRQVK
jgi:hypothetical protein